MSGIDQSYLAEPETRVTDESTGGQKGSKLTQLGALDPVTLIELARVAGMGANKYSTFNFMKGTDWSLMFNAMQRHALRFWAGETTDPESGLNHMAHAAWMALALLGFSLRQTGNDDRPTPLEAPVEFERWSKAPKVRTPDEKAHELLAQRKPHTPDTCYICSLE